MRVAAARVPGIDADLAFAVHEHGDAHVSERIEAEGIWEPFETELLRRLLRAGESRFIDGGANLGWYSVVAATLGAHVVAFEPVPTNAVLLRENVQRNGVESRVDVYECALGRASGSAYIHLSATNQGDHRLNEAATSKRDVIEVDVRTLDDVVAPSPLPTVVKLDTQGSEAAILAGGRSVWNNRQVSLVLEFWPYGLDRAGASVDELLAQLAELVGVTHACFDIQEWHRRLEPRTIEDLRSMAMTGGFSVEMKGFTNLLVVSQALVSEFADLIL